MYLYPHRRHKRISNKHISDFPSVYFGFILGLVFPRHVLLQAGICTKVCTKPCSDTRLALRRGGQVAVIAAIHDRGVVSAPAAIVVGNAVGRWVALALTYGCHYLSDEGDEKARAAPTRLARLAFFPTHPSFPQGSGLQPPKQMDSRMQFLSDSGVNPRSGVLFCGGLLFNIAMPGPHRVPFLGGVLRQRSALFVPHLLSSDTAAHTRPCPQGLLYNTFAGCLKMGPELCVRFSKLYFMDGSRDDIRRAYEV